MRSTPAIQRLILVAGAIVTTAGVLVLSASAKASTVHSPGPNTTVTVGCTTSWLSSSSLPNNAIQLKCAYGSAHGSPPVVTYLLGSNQVAVVSCGTSLLTWFRQSPLIASVSCGAAPPPTTTTAPTATTVPPTTTTTIPPTTTTTVPPTTTTSVAPTTTTTVAPTTTSTTTPPPEISGPGTSAFLSAFWNRPIPVGQVPPANSASIVAAFGQQVLTYYQTVGVDNGAYGMPIYKVPLSQPTTAVTPVDCQNKGKIDPGFAAQTSAVPIPVDAQPSTGLDASLVIWQPSTDTAWGLWRVTRNDGGWTACWGGEMTGVSTSNGVYPIYYGVAATGLPYLGGTITESDISAGVVNHVMALKLPLTTLGAFVAPAVRDDGTSLSPMAITEGTTLRLDPTIDTSKLALTPFGHMVALGLQRYGMVVVDTAGAVMLEAQTATSWKGTGIDPITASFAGAPQYNALLGIPWGSLQVVVPAP